MTPEQELASFVDLVGRMREAQKAALKDGKARPALWASARDLERVVDHQVANLKSS